MFRRIFGSSSKAEKPNRRGSETRADGPGPVEEDAPPAQERDERLLAGVPLLIRVRFALEMRRELSGVGAGLFERLDLGLGLPQPALDEGR